MHDIIKRSYSLLQSFVNKMAIFKLSYMIKLEFNVLNN